MTERTFPGPWTASSPSPVSLLDLRSYVPHSDIPDSYEAERPIWQGVDVMLAITRFTVGRHFPLRKANHFPSRNARIAKRAKRH